VTIPPRQPSGLAVAVVAFGLLMPWEAQAQATPPAVQPAQTGAANNPGWAAKAQPKPQVAATTLDEKQLAAVKRVNTYFNELDNLKGVFVQTGADNKKMRGKFYVKRPGLFRFDYSPPSKMVIVSDGTHLAVQDSDMNTDDRVAIDNTVFRILLKKDVDLIRDARLTEVSEADDMIIVSLQDKASDANGSIKLFLSKAPGLEIKEWITTDAQGLDTHMELNGIVRNEEIDAKLFKPALIMPRAPSGG